MGKNGGMAAINSPDFIVAGALKKTTVIRGGYLTKTAMVNGITVVVTL